MQNALKKWVASMCPYIETKTVFPNGEIKYVLSDGTIIHDCTNPKYMTLSTVVNPPRYTQTPISTHEVKQW